MACIHVCQRFFTTWSYITDISAINVVRVCDGTVDATKVVTMCDGMIDAIKVVTVCDGKAVSHLMSTAGLSH